jgi:hypothetical protein
MKGELVQIRANFSAQQDFCQGSLAFDNHQFSMILYSYFVYENYVVKKQNDLLTMKSRFIFCFHLECPLKQ